MKIKRTWFSTEIDIQPGELREFVQREPHYMLHGLFRWLSKYLDFKPIFSKEVKNE
jgi:hypothetical protein